MNLNGTGHFHSEMKKCDIIGYFTNASGSP